MLLLCVATGLFASPAHAILTNEFLLVNPIHARSIGVGDIGVADNSDPSTIFFNPANVCAVSRIYVTASKLDLGDLPDDTWLRSARAGFSWQSKSSAWTFGADATYRKLNFGKIFFGDFVDSSAAQPDFFEDVLSFTLGAGFRANDIYEFRIGAGVNRWREHYPTYDLDTGVLGVREVDASAFNAGVAFAIHERYGAWNIVPAVGVSMMDMGDDIDYGDESTSELPTRLNFGASVRIESAPCEVLSARVPLLAVIVQAEGIRPKADDADFEWGIGNEIAVAQILFVRTGVHRYATYGDDFFQTTSETRSSWGVGLGIPAGGLRARIDYGRQPPANFSVIGSDVYYLSAILEWTF